MRKQDQLVSAGSSKSKNTSYMHLLSVGNQNMPDLNESKLRHRAGLCVQILAKFESKIMENIFIATTLVLGKIMSNHIVHFLNDNASE